MAAPKVLAMFNNVKAFLTVEEMRELSLLIDKDFDKASKPKKDNKNSLPPEWSLEAVTARLLAGPFKSRRQTIPIRQ